MNEKRKIAVVTGSRAEFGILYYVIKELLARKSVELQLIVTGSHLATSQGHTVDEIESHRFPIAGRIPMFLDGDNYEQIGCSVGLGVIGFSREFARLKPDIVLLLGDRYEIFAVATAAMSLNIPIAHIAGGESDSSTCADGNIRNAITKLAHLHFVSTALYADRIRHMGEEPWRIHTVGLPSLDNLRELVMPKNALANSLGLQFQKRIFLVTYNVVGLRIQESLAELDNMLGALSSFTSDTTIVITLSNADAAGREINKRLNAFASTRPNVHVCQSLGKQRYLSMLSVCDVVIGNSSSGIIEAPSFAVGTVNIGARQDGRFFPPSVVSTTGERADILRGIKTVLSDSFRKSIRTLVNPFGDGTSSRQIADVLERVELNAHFVEKKLVTPNTKESRDSK